MLSEFAKTQGEAKFYVAVITEHTEDYPSSVADSLDTEFTGKPIIITALAGIKFVFVIYS